MANTLPNKNTLTTEIVARCHDFYSDVVKARYNSTRPKIDQEQVVENDDWRYNLSTKIRADQGVSKAELARLVQWKITHGTYRPFLPGMIDKNDPEDVKTCTAAAAKILNGIDHTSSRADIVTAVKSALAEACKLKGVGPATGTLILSIFKPAIVPFFQDETYYWLTSDHGKKLKYDKKEYATLLEGVLDIVLQRDIDARQLEKSVYVLSHTDEMSDEQRLQLNQSVDVKPKHDKPSITDPSSTESKDPPNTARKRKQSIKKVEEQAVSISKNDNDKEGPRRSKRQKSESNK